MDFLLLEKLQGFVNILQAVNTHAAFGGPWLWEAGEIEGPMLQSLNKSDHNTHEGEKTVGYLKREKTSGSKRRSKSHWKKEEMKCMISPSSWLVVQGEGHAEGLGQVQDGEGWFLCDTDQLFSWEHFQKADKHAAIAQVSVQVTNATGHSA